MRLDQIRKGDYVRVTNPNRANYKCHGYVLMMINTAIFLSLVDPKINELHASRFKASELSKYID